MHLHQRHAGIANHMRRVGEAVAVMRERRRVHDDRNGAIRGLMHPVDHLRLVIGLPNFHIQTKFVPPLRAILAQRFKVLMPIHIGLADAKTPEIGSIDHKNMSCHCCPFACYRILGNRRRRSVRGADPLERLMHCLDRRIVQMDRVADTFEHHETQGVAARLLVAVHECEHAVPIAARP